MPDSAWRWMQGWGPFLSFPGNPARVRWGHGKEAVGLAVWPECVTWRGAGEHHVPPAGGSPSHRLLSPARGCQPQPGAAIPRQGHQGREGAFPFSGAPAPRDCGRHGREQVSQSAWVPAALQPAKGTRNCHRQPSSHGTGDSADREPGQELGREAWCEEGVPCGGEIAQKASRRIPFLN